MKCNKPSKHNGKDFWKTIKPIMSYKTKYVSNNITLLEGDNIITSIKCNVTISMFYVGKVYNIILV